MTVCLVTASTFNGAEPTPVGQRVDGDAPLGILSLAGALRAQGTAVVVRDLTSFLSENMRTGRDACTAATDWICEIDADVFAFSTICSTYPFTLRLAEAVRRHLPGRPIILGGPQATVTDRGVLQAFPCVDVVVRGEGEYVLPAVLEAIGEERSLRDVPGITYREGEVARRTQEAPLIMDLDALPDPAFDLDPWFARRLFASIELGRGCPFACEFCSTNDFFRRKFRLKSPRRVIEQMRRVHDQYGHTHFSLTHDMFTVDRRKVVAFCEAMLEAATGFHWSCSARTDCVDADLLELMARAGCDGLFFGVESGSQDQQKRMRKDLDIVQAQEAVANATRLGLSTAVSLIIGFPDETASDFRQTASFMLDACRHEKSEPRVHLLAPLVGTPLAIRYRDRVELYSEVYSDASVSLAALGPDSPERALIDTYPDLFLNFYLMPMHRPPAYMNEARLFLTHGIRRCRWLFVALEQETGSIVDVFESWLAWRGQPARLTPYYHSRAFVQHLLDFLDETYAHRGHPATNVLLRYARALFDRIVTEDLWLGEGGAGASEHVGKPAAGAVVAYDRDALPRLVPRTRLFTLQGSVPSVIDALKRRSPLSAEDTERPSHLLVRHVDDWQELSEVSPLSAAVLRLCDGTRSVSEVLRAFASTGVSIAGAPPAAVCDFALGELASMGLLRFHSLPS